jgi:hypothetical protein
MAQSKEMPGCIHWIHNYQGCTYQWTKRKQAQEPPSLSRCRNVGYHSRTYNEIDPSARSHVNICMFSPKAIVLADPAAWKHLKTIKSQYAFVGTRARPMQDKSSSVRHMRYTGRLPIRSAKIPQNIGPEARAIPSVYTEEQTEIRSKPYLSLGIPYTWSP